MIYRLITSKEADEDMVFLKKSEINAYQKAQELFKELKAHPRTGTGKPEMLRHGKFKGLWSRRITGKHRLYYSIRDKEIVVWVLSARGHYDDK